MILKRSQKVSIIILVVAVLALAVDRLVLQDGGTGVPASSQAAEAYGADPSRAATPVTAARPQASGDAIIAVRLRELAETEGIDPEQTVNAFRAPQSWLKQESAANAETDSAIAFRETHRLTSVLLTSDGGTATVNNQVLAVGDEIDGFRLTKVKPASAVFCSGEKQVELTFSP